MASKVKVFIREGQWICTKFGIDGFGYGDTPKQAYEDWLSMKADQSQD